MKQELATIDSLLRDEAFTQSMAAYLDSSYYAGIGQASPPFMTPGDDTTMVIRPVKEERVATSLAGFYALECGIGLISEQTNQSFVSLLQKVADGRADSSEILLLNRFANATWKAGQPFRNLSRISRTNFTGASLLSTEELNKDVVQIRNAASKLLASMKAMNSTANDSLAIQMKVVHSLLQDTVFAVQMAAFLDSTYAMSQGQKPPPTLSATDDTATVKKSTREIKIATSIAGFYALECGLNYLVTTKKIIPSVILKSLENNTISKEDKIIFARFANATWKAGQPFRSLSRITRATFTPFYFLTEPDIEKDLVQVKAAASKLLAML